MGIVVTVAMLIGLVQYHLRVFKGVGADLSGILLLLMGLWNALWYGLRHITEFWGVVALISGILMVVVAVLILARSGATWLAWSGSLAQRLAVLAKPAIWGLAAFFLLYAVTLIQLNLGMPILG